MNWLNKLRPAKGATAAELSAKLAEAEQQAADLAARVADMERQRGPLLLDGTPAEVKAAEAALAAARDELAALSAMAATLAERAAAAEAGEALAGFRAEVAAAAAESAQIAAWLRSRYPSLSDELAKMAVREQAVVDRIVALVHRRNDMAQRFPEAAAIPLPLEPHTAMGGSYSYSAVLRLPTYPGGAQGHRGSEIL